MLRLLLNWVLSACVLLITANVVPGFHIDGFTAALVTALLLGLINAVVRPVLLLLTLPITVLTLGLFSLVINGLMLWIVASVVKGVSLDTFGTAVIAGIVLWLLNWAIGTLLNRAESAA